MTESNHLCDLKGHTIVKVFKHDSKSELGLIQTMDNFQYVGKFQLNIELPH